MTKDVKISEVFYLAADEYLWDGISEGEFGYHLSPYSCDAIELALETFFAEPCTAQEDRQFAEMENQIEDFLYDLGLTPDSNAFQEFQKDTEAQQGSRYAWLNFCAMIAEEKGS
jgi:hypothetical protein